MSELDQARALYPRVSDIINKQNHTELRQIPLEHLVEASIRGTAVHNYCNIYLKGLWMGEIEQEYKPYVDAFIEWTEKNVEEVVHTSTRLYDDQKKFTGEFDLIVKLKHSKDVVLVDIKTSAKPSKAWPIQLSAYKHLLDVNGYKGITKVFNLHLKKVKAAIYEKREEEKVLVSPPLIQSVQIEHTNLTHYWEIFSSALSCYDYFERKEV